MAYRFTPSGIHKSIPPHSVVLSLTFILPFSLSLSQPSLSFRASLFLPLPFFAPSLCPSFSHLRKICTWERFESASLLWSSKEKYVLSPTLVSASFLHVLGEKGEWGGYCTGTGGCEGRISPFSSSLPPGYKSTCGCVGQQSNKFWVKNIYNKETKKQ